MGFLVEKFKLRTEFEDLADIRTYVQNLSLFIIMDISELAQEVDLDKFPALSTAVALSAANTCVMHLCGLVDEETARQMAWKILTQRDVHEYKVRLDTAYFSTVSNLIIMYLLFEVLAKAKVDWEGLGIKRDMRPLAAAFANFIETSESLMQQLSKPHANCGTVSSGPNIIGREATD